MMNEILFRAWDKKLQRMWNMEELLTSPDYEVSSVLDHLLNSEKWADEFVIYDNDRFDFLSENQEVEYFKTDFDLMQYIGVTDIHGIKIFQNDIIRDSQDKVTYASRGFAYVHYLFQPFEILGNLYQHDKLIENYL